MFTVAYRARRPGPTRLPVCRARLLICEVVGTLVFSDDSTPVIDIIRTPLRRFYPSFLAFILQAILVASGKAQA